MEGTISYLSNGYYNYGMNDALNLNIYKTKILEMWVYIALKVIKVKIFQRQQKCVGQTSRKSLLQIQAPNILK